MHEFLQLTLAQKLSDMQNQKAYTPVDLGIKSPYFDKLAMEEIESVKKKFDEFHFADNVSDKDGVCLNFTYQSLKNKDSALGGFVKDEFHIPASFVEYYKGRMDHNHIDNQG